MYVFYTINPVSAINPIWVDDLRTGEFFFFFSKTTADIRHFVFFAHAEPAPKKAYAD
jgi:hypothetical protein